MTYHATTTNRHAAISGGYVGGKWGSTSIPTSVGGERAARDGWQVTVTVSLPTPSAFVAA